MKLRKASLVALVAWPLFVLVDVYIARLVEPGPLWPYLVTRGIGLALLAAAHLRLRLGRPGPIELEALDAAVCGGLSVLITVTGVQFGGIATPLVMGIMLVIVARTAMMPDHWRRAVHPVAIAVLAHPATLAVMGLFVPSIAAQLAEPELIARFALNQAFLVAAAAIVVVAGHVTWTLQRQLFENRSLGRYKLIRRIGAGGMGEVWIARCSALKREVAVKILRPERRGDPHVVARFEREARATSELVHPHTVRVFDYGATDDGLLYYVMELLAGVDLEVLVHKLGPLHPARAVKLLWQASKGLAEAHARGLTHRDIKPQNLFVTRVRGEGDFVKVLDFGLVKLADTSPDPNLTDAGWAVGTPKWVAPEALFGEGTDARSDVYALGAVLYYCLSGKAPFDYDDPRRNMHAHAHEAPVPPSTHLRRPLPPAIEQVAMRCLEKDPARRYADAAELARALEAAAVATETVPTRPVPPRAIDLDGLVTARYQQSASDTIEEPTRVDHRLPAFE